MTAIYRLLGPVCISEPSICLYVGGKLANEEIQFQENTLFSILYRWSNSPTPASWGSITDAYWICMAWLKVFNKGNSGCEDASDEPSVVFTKEAQRFTKQFGLINSNDVTEMPIATLLTDINHLKNTYKGNINQI